MSSTERQYECIVFGATGYTGKYTCEHITSSLPTDFRWAVAGRSETKLNALVEELRTFNRDRLQPGVEVAELDASSLTSLAKKTKVFISTVGPYHKYGRHAFEACAKTGTHYLDVTGETPWVWDMIQTYHETARKNGAIMIPQNGIESAPTDLMCWMLVSHIRNTLNTGTGEIVLTIHDAKASASGGTLATALTLFDTYGISEFGRDPWTFSPTAPPQTRHSRPLLERLIGVRSVSDLGTLTDSIQGPADLPIVYRSWGTYGEKVYGTNFYVSAYMNARNVLTAFAFHLALTFGFTAILLPPVRWLLKKFVYQPGDGPTKEQASKEYVEWHAIAQADGGDPSDPKRTFGKMRWNGSMYDLTGVCLAQAALVLARERTFAHETGGGVWTPATLGPAYLEGLQKAGLETEVKTLP